MGRYNGVAARGRVKERPGARAQDVRTLPFYGANAAGISLADSVHAATTTIGVHREMIMAQRLRRGADLLPKDKPRGLRGRQKFSST